MGVQIYVASNNLSAGNTISISGKRNERAKLPANKCNECSQKVKCTESQRGRIVSIHKEDKMMQELAFYIETTEGRANARERVKVEHSLALLVTEKAQEPDT